MPEIFNFEQLPKHILRVFPSLGGGGGGKFNSLGLDHSGSQPFSLNKRLRETLCMKLTYLMQLADNF